MDWLQRAIERVLFSARWLMAPVYLCLAAMLVLIGVKFAQELVESVPRVLTMRDTELIAVALTLVDLTLVANLVMVVTLVGYENFVSPLDASAVTDRPGWLDHLDLSGVKQKLLGSIVSIAAIDLLKRFLEVTVTPNQDLLVQTLIFLAFVVAGLVMALTDRLSAGKPPGAGTQ